MTIYKTNDSSNWYVAFTLPSGKRIRKSTGTADKRKAKEIAEDLEYSYSGDKELTFAEAVQKLLSLSEGQKNYVDKARHANYWLNKFGKRTLKSISSSEIYASLPTHNHGVGKQDRPLSNATKNRYLAAISRIFALAEQPITLASFPEPKVNIRWITQEEAKRLIEHIYLPWLQDLVIFALATGCRQGEIFKLQWQNISFERNSAWIGQGDTKSSRARPIPLNSTAMRLLEKRRLLHQQYCFCRSSGLKLTGIDRRVFNKALEKANIAPMTFHDLRHTWASWHVQNGTPLLVLRELGGWETVQMVQKYAHLGYSHLSEYTSASTFNT